MIARAAERNPSVFAPSGPSCNVSTVIPQLLNIAEYTSNPWGNTKFLLSQFKPSPPPISDMSKARRKEVQEIISRSKSLDEIFARLDIERGQGEVFMANLADRLEQGSGDIWRNRQAAEENGEVRDEPLEDDPEERACNEGFEIGIGAAAMTTAVV